jgi:hypothetical protein
MKLHAVDGVYLGDDCDENCEAVDGIKINFIYFIMCKNLLKFHFDQL